MKIAISLLFCLMLNQISYSQVSLDEGEETSNKLDPTDLENKAIQQLKLNPNKIASEFIIHKELPNTVNETVLIIPEIENEISDEDEELFYQLTSHILIVNSLTGKIIYHFSEDSRKNGWVSDAIILNEIKIEPEVYQLTKNEMAFGIQVSFRSMSQPNPYSYTTLSLYIKENDTLKKVLDYLTLDEYSGEVNVNFNDCYANINEEKNEIIILESRTNEYYDIQVKNTIINSVFETNSEGDCENVEKSRVEKLSILRYNNTKYE